MGLILAALMEVLQRPTIWDVVLELVPFVVPLWIAVVTGILVGWIWKPRLASLSGNEWNFPGNSMQFSPNLSLPSLEFAPVPNLDSLKYLLSCFTTLNSDINVEKDASVSSFSSSCSRKEEGGEKLAVTIEDFEHLHNLVEVKDGGPEWKMMMDRSTPNMTYQAWRRDPATGPPQYRSRTIYEDATPETVRDFFWDDEFRSKWDDMLIYSKTLEECSSTGTMIVHWIRKFPFFCSDREYTIGRRIWKVGSSYYCVTKGIPYPSIPRKTKPRRVDLYYSSWCIRAADSRRRDGQSTACEVILFHHEDMGIPWEIAKLGVRQGMWGCVKKIDPGLRAYQTARASGLPMSHSAQIAQINTKIDMDCLKSSNTDIVSSEIEALDSSKKSKKMNIPRFLIVSGAVILACTLDKGLLTKAAIFGIARRFGKLGERL